MIRALWFLVKVGLVVAIAVWVADRPGYVEVQWLDYDFRIHVGVGLLVIMAITLLALFIYNTMKAFADFPGSLKRYFELKRKDKGYRALTLGLTAVAAGDTKNAVYQAHRAAKFLPEDTGLPLLLKAQAARLDGREDEAREVFAALLEDKDAAFLGMRGLLQAALDEGRYDQALELAQEALRLHPKQPWILRIVYDLQIRMENWDKARETLYRARKAGAVDADEANSDFIAMLLIEADKDLEGGLRPAAMDKLKKAHKYNPAFVPTIARLAKIHLQRGHRRKAQTIVEKAWKKQPHPQLVDLWGQVMPKVKSGDALAKMRWYEKLLALNPKSAEGQMAAGRVAMEDGLWGDARNYLKMAEEIEPSVRLYRLWADLEERSTQNEAAVKIWLEKAAEAPQGRVWVCRETGRVYDEWAPVAAPHGSFNTIIWDYTRDEKDAEAELLPPANDEMAEALLEAPKA